MASLLPNVNRSKVDRAVYVHQGLLQIAFRELDPVLMLAMDVHSS